MFPFLKSLGPEAQLAWHRGAPIRCRQFLSDVWQLAGTLPAQGTPINLCVDRYAFAVAWMAARWRGQTSLMPPNPLPATLRQLQETHAGTYVLCDEQGLDAELAAQLSMTVLTVRTGVPAAEAPEGPDEPIDPGRPAVCLLTSGSTDRPQPHLKPWPLLVDSAQAAAQRIAETLGWPSLAGLHLVATVPPQHSYGLESSVLLSLAAGAVLHDGRPFFPADIVEALQQLPRPRALVTTPLHLNHLLRSGLTLPPVDVVLCATAPLSLPLAQQAERMLGGPLVEIYGCTEAGQIATRRTVEGERWTALDGLRLSRSQGPDGDESFHVQGGYLTRAWPLADALQLVDERHFYLRGRANDLINVAGKRNSLSHLNMQLQRIEGVEDGCFWLPDDRPDEVVRTVVFVVAPTLSAEQVVAGLRQRVESAFLPRRVVHVAALPREATGKLTAQALRDFAVRTLGSGA